jgi:hypothetical protein
MRMRTRYINYRSKYGIETVDEFSFNTREERKEASNMVREYNLAFHGGCYLSQRPTKEWRNK